MLSLKRHVFPVVFEDSLYNVSPYWFAQSVCINRWQGSLLVRPVSPLSIHVEPETACFSVVELKVVHLIV